MSATKTCPDSPSVPTLPKPVLINGSPAVMTNTTFNPKLVIVEGNISAGKTTLSRALAKHLNFELFLEPVVENPFLDKFYGNPKRYAFPMQMWFLRQRFGTYVRAIRMLFNTEGENPLRGVIMDRSIFSDAVFALQNFKDGNITKEEYRKYLDVRKGMLAGLPLPHIAVYLDVSPGECYNRIHNVRQRACESSIPLQYLNGLHECHKVMLDALHQSSKTVSAKVAYMQPCKVLTVQWDRFGDAQQISASVAALPTPVMTADGMGQLLVMLEAKEAMQCAMDHKDSALRNFADVRKVAAKPKPLVLEEENAVEKPERPMLTTPPANKRQIRLRPSPCSVTAPQLKL